MLAIRVRRLTAADLRTEDPWRVREESVASLSLDAQY
jgi:hypothetical protein